MVSSPHRCAPWSSAVAAHEGVSAQLHFHPVRRGRAAGRSPRSDATAEAGSAWVSPTWLRWTASSATLSWQGLSRHPAGRRVAVNAGARSPGSDASAKTGCVGASPTWLCWSASLATLSWRGLSRHPAGRPVGGQRGRGHATSLGSVPLAPSAPSCARRASPVPLAPTGAVPPEAASLHSSAARVARRLISSRGRGLEPGALRRLELHRRCAEGRPRSAAPPASAPGARAGTPAARDRGIQGALTRRSESAPPKPAVTSCARRVSLCRWRRRGPCRRCRRPCTRRRRAWRAS